MTAIRVGHLYPDYLNIYADRGNIAVLTRRAAWRGHALEVTALGMGDRITPGEHDLQMHAWAQMRGIDLKVVLTKSDKLSNNELAKSRTAIAQKLAIDPQMLIASSAVTKKGIEEVRREIATRL